MTYKPFVKVPNLTQAGCTRQNRPGRDALIDLGHGSLILFRQNKADVPGPKGRDSLMPTQAGCTRQNRPGRDALIDLGHGSLILFRQNKADVPGPKGRDSLMPSAVKSAKRHAEIAVASSVNALSP